LVEIDEIEEGRSGGKIFPSRVDPSLDIDGRC
jgi:hypothetical protein